MRRALALFLLAIACAAPAGAQVKGRIAVVKPAAAEAGLKGTIKEPGQSEAPPEADAAPASRGDLSGLIPAPLPVTPTGFAAPQGAQQCRRSCAREYYFCRAAEDEICPAVWSRCTARCGT